MTKSPRFIIITLLDRKTCNSYILTRYEKNLNDRQITKWSSKRLIWPVDVRNPKDIDESVFLVIFKINYDYNVLCLPTVLGEILSPTYFEGDFTARRELGSPCAFVIYQQLMSYELDIGDYANFDRVLMSFLSGQVIYGVEKYAFISWLIYNIKKVRL